MSELEFVVDGVCTMCDPARLGEVCRRNDCTGEAALLECVNGVYDCPPFEETGDPEVCDGEDNDCDGLVDEGLGGEPCEGPPTDGHCPGQEFPGTTLCMGGELICYPEPGQDYCGRNDLTWFAGGDPGDADCNTNEGGLCAALGSGQFEHDDCGMYERCTPHPTDGIFECSDHISPTNLCGTCEALACGGDLCWQPGATEQHECP